MVPTVSFCHLRLLICGTRSEHAQWLSSAEYFFFFARSENLWKFVVERQPTNTAISVQHTATSMSKHPTRTQDKQPKPKLERSRPPGGLMLVHQSRCMSEMWTFPTRPPGFVPAGLVLYSCGPAIESARSRPIDEFGGPDGTRLGA